MTYCSTKTANSPRNSLLLKYPPQRPLGQPAAGTQHPYCLGRRNIRVEQVVELPPNIPITGTMAPRSSSPPTRKASFTSTGSSPPTRGTPPSAWFQNGIILLAIFIGTFLYNLILKGQAEAIKDIGARTKKIEQELKSRQVALFNRDFAKDFEDLTDRVKPQNNRLLCFQWGLWITFAVACGLFTVISSQQPRL